MKSSWARFSTLLLFSLLFSQTGYAANENISITKIENQQDFIQLEWNGNAEVYQLYENGNKIYEGKDKQFIHHDLKTGKRHDYILLALDDKKNVKEIIKIETATKKNKAMKEERGNLSINDISINSIISKESIILDWDDIPNVKEYDIYKNGQFIKSVKKSEYKDNTISSTTVYEIIAKKKLEPSKIEERKRQAEESLKRSLTTEEISEISYQYLSIIKLIGKEDVKIRTDQINQNNVQELVSALSGDVHQYKFRYNTFIPDDYVVNPFYDLLSEIDDPEDWEIDTKYFGGDDRGFDPEHSSYRTRTDVIASWGSTSQSVSLSKKIGTSRFYDKNYNLLKTATASSSGIGVDELIKNSYRIVYKLDHEANIPYLEAITPAINYYYVADLYSSGTFEVSGAHDRAPSHEFYVSIDGDDYITLFNHRHQDFDYLWGYNMWEFTVTD